MITDLVKKPELSTLFSTSLALTNLVLDYRLIRWFFICKELQIKQYSNNKAIPCQKDLNQKGINSEEIVTG